MNSLPQVSAVACEYSINDLKISFYALKVFQLFQNLTGSTAKIAGLIDLPAVLDTRLES